MIPPQEESQRSRERPEDRAVQEIITRVMDGELGLSVFSGTEGGFAEADFSETRVRVEIGKIRPGTPRLVLFERPVETTGLQAVSTRQDLLKQTGIFGRVAELMAIRLHDGATFYERLHEKRAKERTMVADFVHRIRATGEEEWEMQILEKQSPFDKTLVDNLYQVRREDHRWMYPDLRWFCELDMSEDRKHKPLPRELARPHYKPGTRFIVRLAPPYLTSPNPYLENLVRIIK